MTPFTWTTKQVLDATGGNLLSGGADISFAAIGIDSRTIAADQLFVAVAGETHDGHAFVSDVLDRGIRGVVVAENRLSNLPVAQMAADGIVCVAVADTIQTLGDLARFNRYRGDLSVVAVTGSNGKTSTRMLMEQVISRRLATLSTQGNLNNHIGLPLTLFRLAPSHRVAVLELGMNHAGEITHLGNICHPDVGVITNVGPAHLEGLGTIDNVARAKAELLPTIRSGGTAILNGDDRRVAAMADGFDGRVVLFGCSEQARVRADRIQLTDAGMRFRLTTPSGAVQVTLATPARVMVSNALAAAATGEVLGMPLDVIRAGLEAFSPQAGRLGIQQLSGDIRLVDDTYNANPESMAAAIETLARMAGGRRTIAVLGDMLELGPGSEQLHREIGKTVGDAGIDRLYATGNFASALAEGARDAGMGSDRVFTGSKTDIIDHLTHHLGSGDLVLVKGSRGMAMEQVVAAISRWSEAQ